MSETQPDGIGVIPEQDSPVSESFLKLPEEILRTNAHIRQLVTYTERALTEGFRIDIITEGNSGEIGAVAAHTRERFETVDVHDIIVLAPRLLLLNTDTKTNKVWSYIDKALAEDGSVAIIDYHRVFEVSKPHAAALFEDPVFSRYLTPAGQHAYMSESELADLERVIWDSE